MTTRNRNPIIDDNDVHETASKLQEALHFLAGAMLSDATNTAQGRRGCSLMLDSCAQAAAYIEALTHPGNK